MNPDINFQNLPVAKDCKRLYKDLYTRFQDSKTKPNGEIVLGTVKLCNSYLEEIEILKSITNFGAQKQWCHYTKNLLTSLKYNLNRLIVKEGGTLARSVLVLVLVLSNGWKRGR